MTISWQIIPAFTTAARTSSTRTHIFHHLDQLAILVGIIGQHVRNHATEIFKLVQDLWDNVGLQPPLMTLVEALGKALDAEFKPFIPMILPPIMKVFEGELNHGASNTQMKIFDAFLTFGTNIEEYLQLVIPLIVKMYERQDASPLLRKKAIHTIEGLTRRVNLSDHASRIIRPLVRVLNQPNNELRMAVLDTLCALMLQLGSEFIFFHPTIRKVRHLCMSHEDRDLTTLQAISRHRHPINHSRYENLITKLLKGEFLLQETSTKDL